MNDKKIFHISSDFDLIKKPVWLDNFRQKYDKPYRYHITLKTSTYFDDKNFENLKADMENIAKKYGKIPIVFDELFINHSLKGGCIMIKAKSNEELTGFQKEISNKFSKYGAHTTDEYEKFERNFEPHITIARHLTPEQLENAKHELKKDLFCEALIETLSLTTVKNDLFEEWSNPQNRLHYKLQNK